MVPSKYSHTFGMLSTCVRSSCPTHVSHSSGFYHPDKIWWRLRIMGHGKRLLYDLQHRGIGVQLPVGQQILHLSRKARPCVEFTQPPIKWVMVDLSQSEGTPAVEGFVTSRTSVEVRNFWIDISSLIRLRATCRDISVFTFTFKLWVTSVYGFLTPTDAPHRASQRNFDAEVSDGEFPCLISIET
jgi:hypothetical protein